MEWLFCAFRIIRSQRNCISIGIYGSLRMFIAEISTMIVHISRSIRIFWFSIRHCTRTLTAENTCNFAIVPLAIEIVDIVGTVRPYGTHATVSQHPMYELMAILLRMIYGPQIRLVDCAYSIVPSDPETKQYDGRAHVPAVARYSRGGTDQMVDTAESTWHRTNTCDVRLQKMNCLIVVDKISVATDVCMWQRVQATHNISVFSAFSLVLAPTELLLLLRNSH